MMSDGLFAKAKGSPNVCAPRTISFRIITPPFMTNLTRSISVTSARGFPETKRSPAGVHMDMGVDHAGEHGRRAQVDHLCTGGKLDGSANVADAVAGDQHDLIVADASRA
jgi:hypothetical protein